MPLNKQTFIDWKNSTSQDGVTHKKRNILIALAILLVICGIGTYRYIQKDKSTIVEEVRSPKDLDKLSNQADDFEQQVKENASKSGIKVD